MQAFCSCVSLIGKKLNLIRYVTPNPSSLCLLYHHKVKCKTHQITCQLSSFHFMAVTERYQLTQRHYCVKQGSLGDFLKSSLTVRIMSCYHFIPPLCIMLCLMIVVSFWGEKQAAYVLGKIPGRLQAQHLTQAENHSQDHSTAAGEGITVQVTQKSRGNFVLTSQGTFHHFSNYASTTKKNHVPQKSQRRGN